MIHNITFAGRETLLTQPAKKIADPVHEYLGDGAIIKDTSVKVADKAKESAEIINNAIRAKYAPIPDVPVVNPNSNIKVVDPSMLY